MLAQAKADNYPVLRRVTFFSGSSAFARVEQLASAANALFIFTSFFGLLGVGVFLHAADALVRLRGEADEVLPA